jgi:UDP-N-acetylmuramyl pentapeptide phosphotransferase/UDP-N-acetylglucosamine-1-phosphate transferase
MHARAFLISISLTLVLCPLIRSLLLRHDIIDQPNERSSHATPTPRGAGLAVATAAVTALIGTIGVAAVVGVVLCSLALGVIGFVDDRRTVSPAARLTAQLLLPVSVLALLLDDMPISNWWTWVFGLGVALWTATYVNAFNFMDGVNGMAVAQTAVAGFGFALMGVRWSSPVLELLGLVIAGTALGFAPYNVPRARLFLGDVGSYFIGSWLALTAVVALRAQVPPEVVAAPFVLYLVDTGLTLARRRRRGVSLFTAHREHAYQQLVQSGWSHVSVAIAAATVMAASTGLSVWTSKSAVLTRAGSILASAALAIGFVALPMLLGQRRRTSPDLNTDR